MEFKLNRKKVNLSFLGGIVFVYIGFQGITKSEEYVSILWSNPVMIWISGLAAFCFFGIGLINSAPLVFSRKAGLIIDNLGIIDNSSVNALGFIDWNDITKIKKRQIWSETAILIYVKNSASYIKGGKTFYSRYLGKLNRKKYGTPIIIAPSNLLITFDEMENAIMQEYDKHNKFEPATNLE